MIIIFCREKENIGFVISKFDLSVTKIVDGKAKAGTIIKTRAAAFAKIEGARTT